MRTTYGLAPPLCPLAQTPLEYRILGYTPEDFPGLTPYLPPLLDQPLLAGAAEEAAAAGEAVVPSGIVPAIAEYPPLPDACRNMPFITLELGSRYSDDKVFAAPEPSYGMDPDYMIQPRLYDMYDSMAHEAGASGGVRAMRGCPALSERWLVRQDTWAVQLGPEVVPELLSGPEAEDLPEDRPEDQDKPKVCPLKCFSAAALCQGAEQKARWAFAVPCSCCVGTNKRSCPR